eukprot:1427343-Prymnesium_polylepis.1
MPKQWPAIIAARVQRLEEILGRSTPVTQLASRPVVAGCEVAIAIVARISTALARGPAVAGFASPNFQRRL